MKIFVLGDPIIDVYRQSTIDQDPDFSDPSTRISYIEDSSSAVSLGGALNLYHALNFIDSANLIDKVFVSPIVSDGKILSFPTQIPGVFTGDFDLVSSSTHISSFIFSMLPLSHLSMITRYMDQKVIVRVDRSVEYNPINEIQLSRLELDEELNIFVLADYLLGGVDSSTLEKVSSLDCKKIIILSTRDYNRYDPGLANLLVANKKDLDKSTLNLWIMTTGACIITDEDRDILVYHRPVDGVQQQVIKVIKEDNPKNTVGAGDVLVASLVFNMANGSNFLDATQSAVVDARLSLSFDLPGYNLSQGASEVLDFLRI